jgi:hypothetical protein
MTGAWHPFEVAGGAVRVWLPPGQKLQDRDGIACWSPSAELGSFTVVSGPEGDGDGDALLEAERAGAEVDVEQDERAERGGLPVRRLRYRTRRHTPRTVIDRGHDGPLYTGDEDVEYLTDVFLLRVGDRLVRVGYSVLATAPPQVRGALAEMLERVRIGDEP